LIKDGEILRKLLIIKDISEKEVAKKFGISERQVYRYYDSETISRRNREKFLDHFGIDLTIKNAILFRPILCPGR